MAALLKSITRQIHWSLLGRAAGFSLAWFLLPGWLFVVIAIALYAIPPFRIKNLIIPFVVLLGVCLMGASGMFVALIYGAIFYEILLIKDLLLIDRRSGQGVLAMALSFFLFRNFFFSFGSSLSGSTIAMAFLVAIATAAMIHSMMEDQGNELVQKGQKSVSRGVAQWVILFIILQALIVCLFLPVDFMYQSIIAFLVAVTFIEFVPSYFSGELSFFRIRTTTMILFSLLVIVLSSVRWGL